MRICISSANNMGKTTLVKDFLKAWPSYKEIELKYRKEVKEKLGKDYRTLTENGSAEIQTFIRDSIIDDITTHTREENVIYDRGLLDNLMYSLYLNGKDVKGCEDEWITNQLPIIKESFKFYDIIFYIPLLAKYPVKIEAESAEISDRNELFRLECDNILKALEISYHKGMRVFFPVEDCPAIIQCFGNPQERIQMIKLYIGEDGKEYTDKDSLLENEIKSSFGILK